ncbi:hypothetical protein BGZ61DRAFT_239566 [Ilyonectria robusta]|uniref:uncharacterized protein n=1 Tax=Ilyonectria robusta TaxID=1079257 RepID=UPI001E8EEFC9|nr:uncharacterized protein BGZ61DRAFT_239566 [Ilyonectria robusta]KAH8699916.1 hypothetical protein BGZ61DRAFT_239566 [Ilyonectria robusta]
MSMDGGIGEGEAALRGPAPEAKSRARISNFGGGTPYPHPDNVGGCGDGQQPIARRVHAPSVSPLHPPPPPPLFASSDCLLQASPDSTPPQPGKVERLAAIVGVSPLRLAAAKNGGRGVPGRENYDGSVVCLFACSLKAPPIATPRHLPTRCLFLLLGETQGRTAVNGKNEKRN